MSRMLKALQQLDLKSPQPPEASESGRSGPPDPQCRSQPEGAPRVDAVTDLGPPSVGRETGPSGGLAADDPAVEAALARVEIAAAAIGRDLDATAPPAQTAPWPIRTTQQHAEAYRQLARNLLSQLPSGGPVVLMFTSPSDGDGKTETLASLAAALAERTPHRVLLVDGNLHKPDLASCLGVVEVTRGLAQVLEGEARWQQAVRATCVPRLDLLPGVKSPAPAVRPTEPSILRALLDELRSQYRLVLIDAASLAHAEAAPMAACCDGTYLIVRLKHTTRGELARAVQSILDCGHLLGSVVVGG